MYCYILFGFFPIMIESIGGPH